MNLEQWKKECLSELERWAGREDLPKPADLKPVNIYDYPKALQLAERVKNFTRAKANYYRDRMIESEDQLYEQIEQARILKTRGSSSAPPVFEKLYKSAASRERALRALLVKNTTYQLAKEEFQQWDRLAKDWQTVVNRLRRDLRIIEIDYASSGGGIG